MSKATIRAVVFHCWLPSHLFYISDVTARNQTEVKLTFVPSVSPRE